MTGISFFGHKLVAAVAVDRIVGGFSTVVFNAFFFFFFFGVNLLSERAGLYNGLKLILR